MFVYDAQSVAEESELLRLTRERDELKNLLDKFERHMAEVAKIYVKKHYFVTLDKFFSFNWSPMFSFSSVKVTTVCQNDLVHSHLHSSCYSCHKRQMCSTGNFFSFFSKSYIQKPCPIALMVEWLPLRFSIWSLRPPLLWIPPRVGGLLSWPSFPPFLVFLVFKLGFCNCLS